MSELWTRIAQGRRRSGPDADHSNYWVNGRDKLGAYVFDTLIVPCVWATGGLDREGDATKRRALTEDVDKGEIDSSSACGATTPVEQGLRIERRAPGEEVDPAKEAREEAKEIACHDN